MKNIKQLIYNMLQSILPEMWAINLWVQYVKHNPAYSENTHQYGYFLSKKKSKKRYCILRYPKFYGIGAVMKHSLLQCEWAVRNQMIPVIDYEWDYYYAEDVIGRDNGWEYVFKPNASLQEIVEQGNNMYVFVGAIGGRYADKLTKRELGSKDGRVIFAEENWREYYRNLNMLSNKWWRLHDDVAARYEAFFSKLFSPDMKILGVALREEFSIDAEKEKMEELKQHPHHLTLDEMIRVIKEYKTRWECTHVFVTTYFEDSIIKLKEEFGDALLYTDRRRVLYEQFHEIRRLVEDQYYRTNKRREFVEWIKSDDEQAQIIDTSDKNTMIEYVEEIYGLSLCDCLIAGKSGGALCACAWNGGKYKEMEILSDNNDSILY
ncbi:MAG: hypothetical protein J1E98_14165 [Lachnospiraceae bacterium]|nr:hypothetical protein [Lachnospiraceae bacterium]